MPQHVEIAYFHHCLNCSVLPSNCIQKRLICHYQSPILYGYVFYLKIIRFTFQDFSSFEMYFLERNCIKTSVMKFLIKEQIYNQHYANNIASLIIFI